MKHFKSSARFALGTISVLILIGTLSYMHLEGWNAATSFYFSTMTLTTVGYGELHPTTDASRLFTSFYSLFGVGLGQEHHRMDDATGPVLEQ